SGAKVKAREVNVYNTRTWNLIGGNPGSSLYVGVSNAELAVTDNNLWNGGNPVYRPVRASAFHQSSYYKYKHNISVWNYDVLPIIQKEFQAYQYQLNDDSRVRHGVVVGGGYQTIPEFVNQDGVDLYEMTTWSLRGIQQLAIENDELKNRIEKIENRLKEFNYGTK